jgi:hypothetical protein
MTNKNPIRLPPLRVLRVRQPNRAEPNPCLTIMSSVLGMFLPSPLRLICIDGWVNGLLTIC